jgi:thioredoxin
MYTKVRKMEKKIVQVYSTTTCPYCNMAKRYLESKGVKYIDYNVELDQTKAYEMVLKSRQMGVPVLDIGGTIIVGFDRHAIDEALSKLNKQESEADKELEEIRKKKMNKLINAAKEREAVINVSEADFDEKVLKKSETVPVLVDFWALWCMPCRMLGPTLEKLAKESNGKFILAKLNVDENENISNEYGISSIPTVKLFKNRKVVDEFVGALPESAVRQWLDRALK